MEINPFKPELTALICEEYTLWCKSNGLGQDKNGLRFGQHLCNTYLKEGFSCPDVFYEVNVNKVFGKVWKLTDP